MNTPVVVIDGWVQLWIDVFMEKLKVHIFPFSWYKFAQFHSKHYFLYFLSNDQSALKYCIAPNLKAKMMSVYQAYFQFRD